MNSPDSRHCAPAANQGRDHRRSDNGAAVLHSGLRRGQDAATAALPLPWSSGAVEGNVNQLILWNSKLSSPASSDLADIDDRQDGGAGREIELPGVGPADSAGLMPMTHLFASVMPGGTSSRPSSQAATSAVPWLRYG